MAVRVYCESPGTLLRKIKAAIRDGSIETWEVDDAGDFTHVPEQWSKKAWLRPKIMDDHLIFNIVGQESKPMARAVYGVYHGRFIEMLLNHFDRDFDRAYATALGAKGDYIEGWFK